MEDPNGAVIVTTPQDIALTDVRKAITFCRNVGLPIIGVIENMSGFICPYCDRKVDIFKAGGGQEMAAKMGIPFLGKIPIEPKIVESGDNGKPYTQYYKDSGISKIFESIIKPLLELN